MQTLKELLSLRDPLSLNEAEVPVELNAIIKAFPQHHGKAIAKLWGGKRLVWHGMRFFDDGSLGEAYEKAEQAAEEYINNGYSELVQLDIEASDMEGLDEDAPGHAVLEFDAEFGDSEGGSRQECYLGYDPKHDKLYIGFDAWTSEESFNDMFDKAFEEATGEEYDWDNPEHHKVLDTAWKEYRDNSYGFWGLVFEITDRNGSFTAEEALPPMSGGFYRGSYKLFKRNHPTVVDLRLD